MSTRATYLLSTDDWNNQMICFYIHSDGYPAGAAYYFWQMHLCKNNRSGYAGRFIRANGSAEFTICHESHDDTEYQYTIGEKGDLLALKRIDYSEEWRKIYHGPWYEFVNFYLDNDENRLYLFKLSDDLDRGAVMTLTEARSYVSEKMEYAKVALSKGWIGNAESAKQSAERVQSQIVKW